MIQKAQHEGTEKRKNIYRLGTGNGSPYPKSNIKERTQACNAFGNARHLGTERHHLIVGRMKQIM